MNWDDLKLFLALLRHGTARRAAIDVGVSHSTVARRIAEFEASFGAKLLEKRADGYALTSAGEGMLVAAEHVEREIEGV